MRAFRLLLLVFLVAVSSTSGAEELRGAVLPPGASLRGRFIQERHLKGFATPLRTEGRFLLAPGRGLIWRAEKPFATVTVITPAGLLQMVDGAETTRLSATRLPFLSRFYDMLSGALSGDWMAMERDFQVTAGGNREAWSIELRPRRVDPSGAMPIEAMTIRGGAFAETVEIRKSGGDWERLTFLDQTLAAPPPSAEDARLFDAAGQ